MVVVGICLLSLLIALPGFINKAGYSFYKGLIPGYNLYLFFTLLEFSPILLGLLGLGMIFLPDRAFAATFLFVLLPFMVSDAYGRGKLFGLLILVLPFIMYPLLGYFLGTYAYDMKEGKAKFFRNNVVLSIFIVLVAGYLYNNYTRIIEGNKLINRSSEHYVNDIYMSDGRIYNNYLNENEKKMYMYLFEKAKMGVPASSVVDLAEYGCMTYEECSAVIAKANDALIVDHPELITYAGYSWIYSNDKLKLTIQMAKTNMFLVRVGETKIMRDVDKIKRETKKMNELEKIKYVYEWIGDNNTYDKLFTYSSKNQSIYNVFMNNNAVCAGFAKASQVIFQNIGIESYGVLGQTSGPHMWNIVEYKDKYYYFDSTAAASFRDKSLSYYYDGLIQEEMNDYILQYPEWYPKIETVTGIYEKK